MMDQILGIDVGGTFTDLYELSIGSDNDCKELMMKSSTTPNDPVQGVMDVLNKACVDLGKVSTIVYGCTIATNAVIERKFPPVAMITTKGFRDTIEIGRYHRKELYNPYQQKPKPLIMRRNRFEVIERVDSSGNVIQVLDNENATKVAKEILNKNIKNIAICFLNSYSNGKNEEEMGQIIKQLAPEIKVSLSSKVLPKIRALGRFTLTALNAILKPIISEHVDRLVIELKDAGFKGKLWLVQSNGGIIESHEAVEYPETLLLSGPAGGVAGAASLCNKENIENLITMDIGGTSTDISIIEGAEAVVTTRRQIDWDMPVPTPMVDITTIGAGGGSLAWIDVGGVLKVGPESAGAYPGPVFYDKGNNQPTLSDANLCLGYINPDNYLGGKIKPNVRAALQSLKEIGIQIGINDEYKVAQGMINIANNNMASAIAENLIKKGRDPRDYVLVAYGGGGPLHAVEVAKILSISKVVIPPFSSVFSAYGASRLSAKHDFFETYYAITKEADGHKINQIYQKLEDKGSAILRREGFKAIELKRYVEMRYVGQSYELEIEVTDSGLDIKQVEQDFLKEHKKLYGVIIPDNDIAILNLRAGAVGKRSVPVPEKDFGGIEIDQESLFLGKRDMMFIGEKDFLSADLLNGNLLKPGVDIKGPAVIEFETTTVLLPPATEASMDSYGKIIINIL